MRRASVRPIHRRCNANRRQLFLPPPALPVRILLTADYSMEDLNTAPPSRPIAGAPKYQASMQLTVTVITSYRDSGQTGTATQYRREFDY